VRALSLVQVLLLLVASLQAQRSATPAPPGLLVTVTDENGAAIPDARIFVGKSGARMGLQIMTDALGKARFAEPAAGTYQVDVRKAGFYELRQNVQIAGAMRLQLSLHHVEEYHETVEVNDSPPEIDPAKTEASETLTNREIFSLPYPSSRDFRNVLPFLPSVVQEASGEIHIAGGAASDNF